MRRISWVRAALKEFQSFPQAVQERMKFALEIAAAGQKADIAKPMKGFDSGAKSVIASEAKQSIRRAPE